MGKDGFRELKVWQKAKELAVNIYRLTMNGEMNRDFGLRDQIRRSSVSVASNIAEGDERGTDKESVRFFFIAKGSLVELSTQVEIARDIGYLNNVQFESVEKECEELGKMIGKLIKSRQEPTIR